MVNRRLFWARMRDVQEGLCFKNISDLVRKEIHGVLESKDPTKNKIRNIKDVKKNWITILILLLCMFIIILCQE